MRSAIEVWNDWKSASLNNPNSKQLSIAAQHILNNLHRYAAVGRIFGIPAWAIGAIHYRESDFDFTTWLANGDPLFRHGKPAVTVHVPKGLGPAPNWEDAATLSLKHQKWHAGMEWDIAHALLNLEAYNGMGYYNHGARSPYIWSGTNHYHFGKYTSDGHYDPSAQDKQLGCAALALALKIRGIDLNEKVVLKV